MAVNLRSLIGKLNHPTRNAVEAAAGLCLSRTHYDVEIEHYLMKLLESTDNDLASILKNFGMDRSRFAAELTRSIDKLKSGNARTPALSPTLVEMLTAGWTLGSIDFNATQVRSGFTILALAADDGLARLMRDERRRSDARVAVLREMADAAAPEPYLDDAADELDLPLAADVRPAGDLFLRREARSVWPRRVAVAATIAALVTLTALALQSTRPSPAPATDASTRPASAQTEGLLELLSLKQTQGTDTLTIIGLVQNPRDGAVLSKVKATALLFGPDGTFLASGGAPLDFTLLRPGDESPFVINVPVTAPVARYRVGFRSEDGHVIGHVDRRTSSTMAGGSETAVHRPRGAS